MIKKINDILNYIQSLNNEIFKKYILVFIISLIVLLSGILYFFKTQNINSVIYSMNVQKEVFNTEKIIKKYKKLQLKKKQIQKLLIQEQNFEIKSFFETFCKQQKLKPESNWLTEISSIANNNRVEEVSLKANFKNQSTESLVKILQALTEKEIVYIKNIKIIKEAGQSISFDMTLANFRYKTISK